MLHTALRRAEDLQGRALKASELRELGTGGGVATPWAVHPHLAEVLPHGLRRGTSVSVSGSLSLLLAVLGGPSSAGAWCALVGMPQISAEAAVEYGVDLSRLPVVADPGRGTVGWATVVGALLDTVDIVVARPPAKVAPGDVQRLSARARSRDSVLIAYLGTNTTSAWPAAELRLEARASEWEGAAGGAGRLVSRRLTVGTEGRGKAARPRSLVLHMPARGGGHDLAPTSFPKEGFSSDEGKDVGVADVFPLPRTG